MASRSPIPGIQFAQPHCHLSENKWEAEGRMGWKEKGEACDSIVLLSQWAERKRPETDKQTDRRMSWWRNIPSSNRTRDSEMTERAWDKSNSLPAGGWQLFIQWAAIETENGNGRRERRREEGRERRRDGLERNWTERSGQTGMSSARLSILSQSEKNSLVWPSPLTDVSFSFLMKDRRAVRKDFQMSLSCLTFSFCNGQNK